MGKFITSFEIDKNFLEKVDKFAVKLEVPRSYVIRRALREYLKNHKQEGG